MASGTLVTMGVPGWLREDEAVCHIEHTPACAGARARWPDWLPDTCRAALESAGIPAPWSHQVELADHAFTGRHVAICTPTASGKTLGYLMPVMAATYGPDGTLGVPVNSVRAQLLTRRRHTALYLAPTKALAHDQLRVCRELGPPGWKVSTLDGDSDPAERRFARDFAGYVLTNPDMLHYGVLPNHAKWAGLLSSLRYVVIDEAHRYSGVFGAHVAQVLRRLRRLCRSYGSDPTFILASATATNAAEAGARLIGADSIEVVNQDSSPHGARDVVLLRPTDSMLTDAARVLAGLVDGDRQTIAFVASRALAELVSVRAGDLVTGPGAIASYRSGYLADDRRRLEAALQGRRLMGVAATNALELGIDVSGMDAVLICGFPGTLAALWQQAGRAGRGARDALVVLLAREDPLDAYLFEHPELIFDAPIETTVLHPENPFVLGPHLAAAAQEMGLTDADSRWFGPGMASMCERLCAQGVLRARPAGWFWPHAARAVDSIDLRSIGGRPFDIVDAATGRVLGQVDPSAADRSVYPGAVYLHQGETWLVEHYSPDERQALVHAGRPGYYTQPKGVSQVRILAEQQRRPLGRAQLCVGDVELTGQVVGYLRRDEVTGEVWDETPLDLPVHLLTTRSVWLEVPDDLIAELGWSGVRAASAAHAAEHCAIGLLGLFAPCDRWDIGGLSTLAHRDTGVCTIFVHDGLPGGAGFADRGFTDAEPWLSATLHRLQACGCQSGCPACVISPKCGNANQFLDKDSAAQLLAAVLGG